MIYTGIGARNTPPETLQQMRYIGQHMAMMGHELRSGGAGGADEAFEEGCIQGKGLKEIYLPKKGFRGNPSPHFTSTREAMLMAKLFHTHWKNLKSGGRAFMARNAYQVLGLELNTPTDLIVCWTPQGKIVGGTGQALRMAEHYRIPILNLWNLTNDEVVAKLRATMELSEQPLTN